MSVIIRLQNLPWTGNALDIRRFFAGLTIPDGGVHIVGGDEGDAFIAFSNDEDARKAMQLDGGRIKDTVVRLFLSSKTQMQSIIAQAREQASSANVVAAPPPQPLPPQHFNQAPPAPYNAPMTSGPPPNQVPPPFGQPPQAFGQPPQAYGQPINNAPLLPNPPLQVGPPPPPTDNFRQNQNQYTHQQAPVQDNYRRNGGPRRDERNDRNSGWDRDRPQNNQYNDRQTNYDRPPQNYDRSPQDRPPQNRSYDRPQEDRPPFNRGPAERPQQDRPPFSSGPNENPQQDRPPFNRGADDRFPQDRPPFDSAPQNDRPPQDRPPYNRPANDRPPQDRPPYERQPSDDYQRGRIGRGRGGPPYRNDAGDRRDSRGPPRKFSPPPPRDEFNDRRFNDVRRDDSREEIKRQPAPQFVDSLCVFVSNIPKDCQYRDIRRFFRDCFIPSDGLKILNNEFGERKGEAYVQFKTYPGFQDGLKFDGAMLMGRRVLIDPCSFEEWDLAIDSFKPPRGRPRERSRSPMRPNANRSRSPLLKRPDVKPMNHSGSFAVLINVPYSVTKPDVRDFCAAARIADNGNAILVEVSEDGRCNGNVLVEFETRKDLLLVLGFQKRIYRRPVDVKPISEKEYRDRCEKSKQNQIDFAKSRRERPRSPNRDIKKPRTSESKDDRRESSPKKEEKDKDVPDDATCMRVDGVPFSANTNTLIGFFKDCKIAEDGVKLIYMSNGNAAGIGFVEFATPEDCKKAKGKNNQFIGKRYVTLYRMTKDSMLEAHKKEQIKFGDAKAPKPPMEGLGKPGCVLGMQNLPYGATLDNITGFFKAFNPIVDSVKIRYGPNGKPTGDAMVAFESPEMANKALETMHQKSMFGRRISIHHA